MNNKIKNRIKEIKNNLNRLCDNESDKKLKTTIYKEDFTKEGWQDYCKECDVPINCDQITIHFNPSDVQVHKNYKLYNFRRYKGFKCPNCGYYHRNDIPIYQDELGYHVICEDCETSSDIEVTVTPIEKMEATK